MITRLILNQWKSKSIFSYYNTDPDNIRNKADIGGGGLMDIGCYCISLSRFIFGAEPLQVCGIMEEDPNMKVDCLTGRAKYGMEMVIGLKRLSWKFVTSIRFRETCFPGQCWKIERSRYRSKMLWQICK